jgi:Raf kinase inhibitor-like YbhB/YbcL family protein
MSTHRNSLGRDRAGMGTLAVPAALLLAALLLAACGGTGGGSTGSGPATSTPAGRPAPPVTSPSPDGITVRSPAFAAGAAIPVRFSCRGSNTPIPLTWTGIPAGAASVALIMDDPDAPSGTFTHWVVYNLPATSRGITNGRLPAGAAQAQNGRGQAAYTGPCPPSGTHHYRFTVYAEPERLPLRAGAPLPAALAAITANPLSAGRLTGLFASG